MIPYPHQSALVDDLASAFGRHRRVLGQAPCGFGKTPTTAWMAARAISKGRTPVISVPRLELLRQTQATFDAMGVKGAVIDTMQSLVRREPCGDFLINDEAHYGLSGRWGEYLGRYPWVLGLTASPIPGMDLVYDELVIGPPVAGLIAGGFLSDYRGYAPSQPDLSGLRVSHGEYVKDDAEAFMSKPSVTGSAVGAWLQFAKGKRTLGYAVSRKHSRELVDAFLAAGIPAEHIDGETPDHERRAIIARFADGETRVMFSVDLITLGFDLAAQIGRDVAVEAMSDQRPTKSLALQVQKWGRALRRKSEPAVILDHARNFETHGLPDQDIEWTIMGRRSRATGVVPVSICTGCFAAFKTAPACPYCHAPRALTPREVEKRDGELAEIERERMAARKRQEVGMASRDGLEGLARVAKERGYKPGWLVHRMKLKGTPISYDVAVRAMRI